MEDITCFVDHLLKHCGTRYYMFRRPFTEALWNSILYVSSIIYWSIVDWYGVSWYTQLSWNIGLGWKGQKE